MLRRDRLGLFERLHGAADGLVAVLALGRELELDQPRVAVAEHDDLGRPAGQVDRHVARDLELRVVHVRAAGPDDLVDALDVGEPADRLRPPSAQTSSTPSSSAAAATMPDALRRRADDDPPHAGHLRRHDAHDECRDEVARHVDADGVERHPAPLEHDARLDLERHVRRTLHRVPAAHPVGELEDRLRAAAPSRRRPPERARRRPARAPTRSPPRARAA